MRPGGSWQYLRHRAALVRGQPQESRAPRIEDGPGPQVIPRVALRIAMNAERPPHDRRSRLSGSRKAETAAAKALSTLAGVDCASEVTLDHPGRVAAPAQPRRLGRVAERAPAERRRGETRSRSRHHSAVRPSQRPVERAENAHVPRAQRDDGQSAGISVMRILPEPDAPAPLSAGYRASSAASWS